MKESMGANCIKMGTAFSDSELLKKMPLDLIRKCGHTCNIQTSRASLQQVVQAQAKVGSVQLLSVSPRPMNCSFSEKQASKFHLLETRTSSLGNRIYFSIMLIDVFARNEMHEH